jgi:hypothetical protein
MAAVRCSRQGLADQSHCRHVPRKASRSMFLESKMDSAARKDLTAKRPGRANEKTRRIFQARVGSESDSEFARSTPYFI